MDQYVGLDVSLRETWISVRQDRKRIWHGKCVSHPRLVASAIRRHAPGAVLVVFETGSLSTWFHRDLTATSTSARSRPSLPSCRPGASGAEERQTVRIVRISLVRRCIERR